MFEDIALVLVEAENSKFFDARQNWLGRGLGKDVFGAAVFKSTLIVYFDASDHGYNRMQLHTRVNVCLWT